MSPPPLFYWFAALITAMLRIFTASYYTIRRLSHGSTERKAVQSMGCDDTIDDNPAPGNRED